MDALVLAAITTTSAEYVEWITESMRRVFPREWDDFAAASGRRPGQRVVDAYLARITDPDPAVRVEAARAWCAWEDVHVSLGPGLDAVRAVRRSRVPRPVRDPRHPLLGEFGIPAAGRDPAGDAADRRIPGVMIHGRYDVSGPLSAAWDLHKVWPASRLVVVGDGHGGPAMSEAITRAVASFA